LNKKEQKSLQVLLAINYPIYLFLNAKANIEDTQRTAKRRVSKKKKKKKKEKKMEYANMVPNYATHINPLYF